MQLNASDNYRINRIRRDVPVSYRHKLMSMGLLPGTAFEVVGVAPLGDPVAIKVKGFLLSLRKSELEALDIEAV